MYISVKKQTKSGGFVTYKVNDVKKVIVFDDVKARLQIDEDCCCRTPVRDKVDLDKAIELE